MADLHLECTPDEVLVKNLGRKKKEVKHHNDKGRVCKFLTKSHNVIGMIDQDPDSTQPSYLKTLVEVSNKHDVKVLQDDKRTNKVAVLCPRLEEWLIQVCKSNKVDITKFGLSNKGNDLHREINGKLENLDKLLLHLIKFKQAPQMLHLKGILKGV